MDSDDMAPKAALRQHRDWIAELEERLDRQNERLEALEARMEQVVTVETSEERMRRVYPHWYGEGNA